MYLEVHILQNFAPSNLNRDDTGNPKDTEFGGARRGRISSQCIKRAIRTHPAFAQSTQVDLAVRTRWMNRMVANALTKAGKPEDRSQEIADAFAVQYSKLDKGHTAVLLFLSASELKSIVSQVSGSWDDIVDSLKDGKSTLIDGMAKELFKSLKDRTSAPDIALFGRMLAEKPELNIDAACQVAHAISTHRANMEMDFYTAVDELSTDEETGAGMMGVIPFNSACFYRYACIDWNQLVKNLGGDVQLAQLTVAGFLRAAALAVPTGKQNSFAAQNPPDFLLGVARSDGQAWSLANAFETPVRPERAGGLLEPSIRALDEYWGKLKAVYGSDNVHPAALAVSKDAPLENLKMHRVDNLEAWANSLVGKLPKEWCI